MYQLSNWMNKPELPNELYYKCIELIPDLHIRLVNKLSNDIIILKNPRLLSLINRKRKYLNCKNCLYVTDSIYLLHKNCLMKQLKSILRFNFERISFILKQSGVFSIEFIFITIAILPQTLETCKLINEIFRESPVVLKRMMIGIYGLHASIYLFYVIISIRKLLQNDKIYGVFIKDLINKYV